MDPEIQEVQGLHIAVEGCGHGTLNAIYAAVEKACEARAWDGVDLLIIGGDFQAMRNASDLTVMACPVKYREIGDFHEYYSGVKKAPYLTIFVGGNHEASSHLWELYYGGWVAPNIYYMGAANVVRLGTIRIAGMSGIWKGYNFKKPHFERLPYGDDDIRSLYHVRELDVRKLLQVRTQVDICVSHDWPRAIEKYGDERQLFRMKPAFEQESKDGTLGSIAATYVLDRLRPPYWFAAHMHCRFAATRTYKDTTKQAETNDPVIGGPDSEGKVLSDSHANEVSVGVSTHNADEIDLDMDDDDDDGSTMPTVIAYGDTVIAKDREDTGAETSSSLTAIPQDLREQLPAAFSKPTAPTRLPPGQPCPPTITNKVVRFLALDKCLPGRKFLQLLDVESSSSAPALPSSSTPRYHLEYDLEWLAIIRVFASSLTLGDPSASVPPDLGEEHYRPLIKAEEVWVDEHIVKPGKLIIPENFTITAPIHVAGMPELVQQGPEEYNNPQMAAFCNLLGIENKFFATDEEKAARMAKGPMPREPRGDGGFGSGRDRGRGGGRGGGRGRGRGRGGGRGRGFGRGSGRSRGFGP